MELLFLSGAALDLVAVKHQYQPAFFESRIAGQGIAQASAGSVQIVLRRLRQRIPGENNIVAIHDQVLLPGGPNGQLFLCGPVFRGFIEGGSQVAELPAHDLLQGLVIRLQIPGDHRRLGLQAAFQVHIVLHPVPGHMEAGAVIAEHGIRGVGNVRQRIVADFLHHFFGVVAGSIAVERQLQLSSALGVGRQLVGIVPQLRSRHQSLQGRGVTHRLRGIEFAAHGADIRDGTADLLCGQRQPEIVPGFQQHAFGLHQALAHRPVGSLPEVTALGVLDVGSADEEGDL